MSNKSNQNFLFICIALFYVSTCYPSLILSHKQTKNMDNSFADIVYPIPADKITIKYSPDANVLFGNELTPTAVKDKPTVNYQHDANKLYLLAMIDPDAPSRQNNSFGPILHWLVADIPGDNVSSGRTLAEYRGSGPPKGTGLHRYIFLVYEQQRGKKLDEQMPTIAHNVRNGRVKFKINNFVDKHQLGKPIAANFYVAQFDDYVLEMSKSVKAVPKTPGALENLLFEKVWPDVIDTLPDHKVVVKYPSGATAEMGNDLTPTSVQNVPIEISFPTDDNKIFYTVAMVDPDAPSKTDRSLSEFLHYLVVDIPGGDFKQGRIIASYAGSGPPKGSGSHRYVWLVYKQLNGKLETVKELQSQNATGERVKFSTRKWAKEHKLGEPIAANFYEAQWDDYVPQLQARFGY